jgi:hypothetical protein
MCCSWRGTCCGVSAGIWAGFCETKAYAARFFVCSGSPAFRHASSPPWRARTSLYPCCINFCAKLALEPSFGQVQYVTMGFSFGILGRFSSSFSSGRRIASGNMTSDCAQACGLRTSMTVKSSPASIRRRNSSIVIRNVSATAHPHTSGLNSRCRFDRWRWCANPRPYSFSAIDIGTGTI